ncbi:hypothetical protein L2E82_08179 [Cichorium intybus]|uniref:Uncharacterized protein n=1 Tax=Cichorium intybus TaxID=13427 RepID=A0ACB9G586_CICIN|nr:hypothetical protein L2E82_08179 [Cichorium intybus]
MESLRDQAMNWINKETCDLMSNIVILYEYDSATNRQTNGNLLLKKRRLAIDDQIPHIHCVHTIIHISVLEEGATCTKIVVVSLRSSSLAGESLFLCILRSKSTISLSVA